jgi:hypothetical protein
METWPSEKQHLFDKLISVELLNKLFFLFNLKVYYRVDNSPPLGPILRQINPVQNLTPFCI